MFLRGKEKESEERQRGGRGDRETARQEMTSQREKMGGGDSQGLYLCPGHSLIHSCDVVLQICMRMSLIGECV